MTPASFAGLFMSYIGLNSYYQVENWEYQASYASDNTPWFFNGVRIQIFPSKYLKIEPWIINGWQSYGKSNTMPGLGANITWNPTSNFKLLPMTIMELMTGAFLHGSGSTRTTVCLYDIITIRNQMGSVDGLLPDR